MAGTSPAMTPRMERRQVNIGFVGLGAMGALIVPRLMAAGHKVTGWNRSRDKAEPLIAAGMAFAATPPAVAEVTRIGGNGLACQMKIAVNLLLMVEVVCFGEAVALAEKGGVSREAAVDAILKSVAASPVLGYRGPFILDGKMPQVPLADVTLQQKDMVLALNLARQLGSPTPLAAAANEMMNACRGLGIDGNDFVVAHEVYRSED